MGHWTATRGELRVFPRPDHHVLDRVRAVLLAQPHGNLWHVEQDRLGTRLYASGDIKGLRDGVWAAAVQPAVRTLRATGFTVQGAIRWQDEDGASGTVVPEET